MSGAVVTAYLLASLSTAMEPRAYNGESAEAEKEHDEHDYPAVVRGDPKGVDQSARLYHPSKTGKGHLGLYQDLFVPDVSCVTPPAVLAPVGVGVDGTPCVGGVVVLGGVVVVGCPFAPGATAPFGAAQSPLYHCWVVLMSAGEHVGQTLVPEPALRGPR